MPEPLKDESFAATQALSAAQGHGVVDDPYPTWRALREESPIHKLDLMASVGLGSDADYRSARGLVDVYSVFSHELAARVLRDNASFHMSHPWPGEALPRIGPISTAIGRSFLDMDGAPHRRIRSLLTEAFSAGSLQRWMNDLVLPIIHRHIDAFVGRGEADLLAEFTWSFPVEVITGILGLPDDDVDAFHEKAEAILNAMADWDAAIEASRWLESYLAQALEDRRRRPGGSDIVSLLIAAEIDGDRLTDEEIYPFLKLLLPAGADTTFRGSSNAIFAMLTHPEQMHAARDDRGLVPGAVEESLRWEAPVTMEPKSVITDVELGGIDVPAGAMVTVCIGAANRDSGVYDRPDDFDMYRPRTPPHLSFGGGHHICLGQHLARMEMVAALNALFDRLPNVELVADPDTVGISGFSFRVPANLPVRFDN